jgi:RNA polymerase sigma factor (sigma-70 family)
MFITGTIGPIRRLTAGEEYDLACRARAGDGGARKTLIESNIPLAIRIGSKFLRSRLGEDAVSVAMVGLCRGVDYFDPAKGKLSTYVARTIFNEIFRAIRAECPIVHVPEDLQKLARAIDAGRPATPRWPGELVLLPAARAGMAATSRLGGPGGHDPALPPARERPDADELARLRAAVAGLPPDLAATVRLYFLAGAGDGDDHPSLAEVGKRLGIGKKACQMRLASALARLRRALADRDEVRLS